MTLKTNAFATLDLAPATLANLEQLGYLEMTPIQAASLPVALAGTDLIAQAKTGSGKTAAFALALLTKLNPRWFSVQAMVMCPTRELADTLYLRWFHFQNLQLYLPKSLVYRLLLKLSQLQHYLLHLRYQRLRLI